MRAKLSRPAEFKRKMAGTNDSYPLIAGPGLEQTAQGAAQFDKPPGLRKWRREDVRVDGHNGQIGLRARRNDGAGNAVIDAQFVAEGEVETGIQPGAQQVCREFFVSFQFHTRQSEFAFLIVIVGVVEGRFADEELRSE